MFRISSQSFSLRSRLRIIHVRCRKLTILAHFACISIFCEYCLCRDYWAWCSIIYYAYDLAWNCMLITFIFPKQKELNSGVASTTCHKVPGLLCAYKGKLLFPRPTEQALFQYYTHHTTLIYFVVYSHSVT